MTMPSRHLTLLTPCSLTSFGWKSGRKVISQTTTASVVPALSSLHDTDKLAISNAVMRINAFSRYKDLRYALT